MRVRVVPLHLTGAAVDDDGLLPTLPCDALLPHRGACVHGEDGWLGRAVPSSGCSVSEIGVARSTRLQ